MLFVLDETGLSHALSALERSSVQTADLERSNISDAREVAYYLDLQVERSDAGFRVHEEAYALQILAKTRFEHVAGSAAPLDVGKKLGSGVARIASSNEKTEELFTVDSGYWFSTKTDIPTSVAHRVSKDL